MSVVSTPARVVARFMRTLIVGSFICKVCPGYKGNLSLMKHLLTAITVIIRYCDNFGEWQKCHKEQVFTNIRLFYSTLAS